MARPRKKKTQDIQETIEVQVNQETQDITETPVVPEDVQGTQDITETPNIDEIKDTLDDISGNTSADEKNKPEKKFIDERPEEIVKVKDNVEVIQITETKEIYKVLEPVDLKSKMIDKKFKGFESHPDWTTK